RSGGLGCGPAAPIGPRSSCTSPRTWSTAASPLPASRPCSTTAAAFPRKRFGASPATARCSACSRRGSAGGDVLGRDVLGRDILDIGRKTRRIPPALRRAVTLRDHHCQFPGCTHDRFIDLHHIEHWLHGGATSKQNLIALCPFHHRLVHEGGFTLELGEDGEPRFLAPDGLIPSVPAIPELGPDAIAAIKSAHADLAIDEDTGLTSWDGSPIDYPACVGALCAADEPDLHLPVRSWLAKH